MRTTGRLTAQDGALFVVDLQERLLAAMPERGLVVANAIRLIRGARLLELPVTATEQYPKGLGPTVAEVAELVPERPSKTSFHCAEGLDVVSGLRRNRIRHVTLAGIETHICVAQTALELMQLGYIVQIAADAVGSRRTFDKETALRRLAHAGAIVSSTEAILFEWTERSDRPEFKAVSDLVKSFDDSEFRSAPTSQIVT